MVALFRLILDQETLQLLGILSKCQLARLDGIWLDEYLFTIGNWQDNLFYSPFKVHGKMARPDSTLPEYDRLGPVLLNMKAGSTVPEHDR